MKAKYIQTKLKTVINISRIVTIHYFEFDQKFSFPGEQHNFWEMVYIDKGTVAVSRDNEDLILRQGEVIFHRPNEFHTIRALESSPNIFVISFVCDSPAMQCFEWYKAVLNKTHRSFLSSIIKESDATYRIRKNDPTIKKLIKKETPPIGGEQLIKTYLEQFLILLMRSILSNKTTGVFPSKESLENHLIVEIKEYLYRHVEQRIRVSDICDTFGYSKSYLSKLFHEQCGETLVNYAVRIKINRAKDLIRENNLNFAQISSRLSFDNPQYFSRVFKRYTDMSPTEFKNSLSFESEE